VLCIVGDDVFEIRRVDDKVSGGGNEVEEETEVPEKRMKSPTKKMVEYSLLVARTRPLCR
jgi:hypothetical protein